MVRHRLLMYITDLEELLASNFLAMCYFLFKGVFLGIDSVGATNFCNNNRRLAGCILTEEKKNANNKWEKEIRHAFHVVYVGVVVMPCVLYISLYRCLQGGNAHCGNNV